MDNTLVLQLREEINKVASLVGYWIPRHVLSDGRMFSVKIAETDNVEKLFHGLDLKKLFGLCNQLIKVGAPRFSLAVYESFLCLLAQVELRNDRDVLGMKTLHQYAFISERALGRFDQALSRIDIIQHCGGSKELIDQYRGSLLPFNHSSSETKSAAYVKDIHEELWSDTGAAIRNALNSGSTLTSVLMKHNFPVPRRASSKPITSSISNRLLADHQDIFYTKFGFPLFKPAIAGGEYGLCSNILPIPMFLNSMIGSDVKNVVELGSGWGRNLMLLIEALGSRASDKSFYFLEYSQAGVNASDTLVKELQTPFRHSASLRFDYTKGLPEEIKKISGKTVFFSCFSIEQVPKVGRKFFTDMSSLPFDFVVFNFEPIGWQTIDAFVRARAIKDRGFFEDLAISREYQGASEADVSQALNSYRMSYNYDFLGNLKTLDGSGDIVLEDISKYHSPPNDIHNPATLAIWSNGSSSLKSGNS